MLIKCWLVIILLGALGSYLLAERKKYKHISLRYHKALEQIKAHGDLPVIDQPETPSREAQAYRMAYGFVISIARRALR